MSARAHRSPAARLWALGAVLGVAGAVQCVARAEPSAPAIDLAQAVARASESHPAVLAARQRYEAMLERPGQARALPDPMIAASLMFVDVETANGPSTAIVEVAQEFPYPGKRGLRAGVSRLEAASAEQAWRTAALDVAYQVRSAYYELFRIDAAVVLVEEEAALLDRLERVAGSQYAAGQGGQADVLQAQAERSMIERRLIELRAEREMAAARFNAALDLPQRTAVGPALEPPPLLESLPAAVELYAAARRLRPEVDEAEKLVGARRLDEALARREFLPDFTVALQWNQIGSTQNPFAPDPGRDAYMATLGVRVPLWRGKLRAGLREAQSSTRSARSEAEARGIAVEAEVRTVLASLRAQQELLRLYDTTLIPQAEAAQRAAEAAYRAGRGDFLAVLDAERRTLELRLVRLESLAGLGQSAAALERALGAPLDEVAAAVANGAP